MKILANEIRNGFVIELNNSLWKIVKNPEHTKPGKGGAYVQVEMRNLYDFKKLYYRFNAHQSVERAYIEERKLGYLYCSRDEIVFIDKESLEEVFVRRNIIQNLDKFLLPEIIFTGNFFNQKIIDIKPPKQIILRIKESDLFMKSYRESPTYKSAITENDIKVMVPTYINAGDKILINTDDMSFIEKLE